METFSGIAGVLRSRAVRLPIGCYAIYKRIEVFVAGSDSFCCVSLSSTLNGSIECSDSLATSGAKDDAISFCFGCGAFASGPTIFLESLNSKDAYGRDFRSGLDVWKHIF
jgi:hypothetical protein